MNNVHASRILLKTFFCGMGIKHLIEDSTSGKAAENDDPFLKSPIIGRFKFNRSYRRAFNYESHKFGVFLAPD